MKHLENHRTHRIGWLRAAVLGANDGIVSAARLIVGVAANTMSMAAGEYVSVSSQSNTKRADLDRERMELASYVNRGLDAQWRFD